MARMAAAMDAMAVQLCEHPGLKMGPFCTIGITRVLVKAASVTGFHNGVHSVALRAVRLW